MQTVLVTGGCGLIGQHICSGLLKKGCEVIALDRHEGNYNMGKRHYTFIKCEPTNKTRIEEIFENNNIDILVHASFTVDNDLDAFVTEKEVKESAECDKIIYRTAMRGNSLGVRAKKVIMISTDQVYEFPKTREPIRETGDLKPVTNYAIMKYSSEKALLMERNHHKENQILCCIIRNAPVYTLNFTDNLVAKITDPKDKKLFVYGEGQYGFQMCCVHNLVDFILCFVQKADDTTYEGVYNVCDKHITKACDIIDFMNKHHQLGEVVQRTPNTSKISRLKNIFSGVSKEEKTNYRYLDLNKLENNNMLDTTKASKLAVFRWNIDNTK